MPAEAPAADARRASPGNRWNCIPADFHGFLVRPDAVDTKLFVLGIRSTTSRFRSLVRWEHAMKTKPLGVVVLATAASMLVACGGSSDRPTLTDDEIDRVLADPAMMRLEGILDRSDTLLVPSLHLYFSLSAEGMMIDERMVEGLSCAGASCAEDDGTALTVQDLIDPFDLIRNPPDGIRPTEFAIDSRGGFDTVTLGAQFEASEGLEEVTITDAPSVFRYGFWGEHGFGAVDVAHGSFEGSIEGMPLAGELGSASAYAAGDAAGTNPTGMGSATWSGIAEAAFTGDFERHQGTATVTIADLSRPRVGVDIEISGQDIGAPEWVDMPLVDGRFTSGDVDTGDYLAGDFHGPNHEETYGVFDTGDYVGAFGAKRLQ